MEHEYAMASGERGSGSGTEQVVSIGVGCLLCTVVQVSAVARSSSSLRAYMSRSVVGGKAYKAHHGLLVTQVVEAVVGVTT